MFLAWQGIDPSIRAEVWEFLLGCYSLGSTAEHRRKLRTARRLHLFFFFFTVFYLNTFSQMSIVWLMFCRRTNWISIISWIFFFLYSMFCLLFVGWLFFFYEFCFNFKGIVEYRFWLSYTKLKDLSWMEIHIWWSLAFIFFIWSKPKYYFCRLHFILDNFSYWRLTFSFEELTLCVQHV